MSNFLTPVKITNVTYDKFIFSLFINSPEAKPGTVKYKFNHCSRSVKCGGSTNSNLYKHLLRVDNREWYNDIIIDKYVSLIANYNYEDPLLFWKDNEYSFPLLAPLAKRFLGVPASSASVERMFNISGHIFTSKRRRTSVYLYENLVFLKLNEYYLNKI